MNGSRSRSQKIGARLRIWALLPLMILIPEHRSPVYAQDKCENAIQKANGHIARAYFEDAIELLLHCQPQLKDLDEKLEALRLLGLAYVGQNYLEHAKKTVYKLLDLAPDWEPDPDQNPPQFIKIVNVVKQQKQEAQKVPTTNVPGETDEQKKKGGGKKWLLIAGGGAVAAALTIALISGGGGDNRLPGPPAFP
ncbi:MAG: hypothetical protein ACE5IR_14655 [bacterium]